MTEIIERARLRKQAIKRERLERLHDMHAIHRNLEVGLEGLWMQPYKVNLSIEFEKDDHLFSYLDYANRRFSVKPKKETRKIEIEREIGPHQYDLLHEILDIVSNPRSFHFSPTFRISIVDEIGYKVYELVSSSEMVEDLPKVAAFLPQILYEGRTTYYDAWYDGVHEKKLLKDHMYRVLRQKHLIDCLFLDSLNRRHGYEKFVPERIEDHPHYRIKINRKWRGFKVTNRAIFPFLVYKHDAMCFYPRIKQDVKFEGRVWKNLTTRFVNEIDPGVMTNLDYCADVMECKQKLMKKYRIPAIFCHSGSVSPTASAELDAKSILRSLDNLLREFKFIGYAGGEQPIRKKEENYERVTNAFNGGIYLHTWNSLIESKIPTIITSYDKSLYRPAIPLDDFPRNISTGLGSPKCIVRKKRILEKLRERQEGFEGWSLPFFFTHCNLFEKCPRSREEIAYACNTFSTMKALKEGYRKIAESRKKAITADTIRHVLGDINERQFIDLYTLKERKFIEKYSNLDFPSMLR